MNKVVRISLGLTLLFSIYACNSSVNNTFASINNNGVTPLSSNKNNGLKPFSRPRNGNNILSYPSSSSSSTPQATSTPTATINTQPSSDTGTSPDIISRSTVNGKVFDRNGNPITGVTVTAKSLDNDVNWIGETQTTTDSGAYVFRNAPSGVRLVITITKDGVSRSRHEVLKSSLQGDPLANVFDFSSEYSLDGTKLWISLFDDKNQEFKNATITIESLDQNFKYVKQIENVSRWISSSDEPLPVNTKFKITVSYNGKQKERIITTESVLYNEVKFGGTNDADKPFAISNVREQELDPSINKFVETNNEKFSTFSVDTDTASYTLMRDSILRAGSLPSKDSVRLEEYVNYFDYDYPKPQSAKFSINTELAPSPFDKTNTKHIFRIGIQGQEISTKNRKDSILTFLIDTSGSMADDNKLNTIKNSLKIMLKQLKPTDKVAIVEYNFLAKTILKHTLVRDESKIVQAIDSLKAISTTDIEKGLREAFKQAQESYDPDYLNRIILCSDGINSTEIKNPEELVKQIRKEYETKVSVSAIGVGFTNYNDTFLETIASKNDGYYSYIDNVKEAVRLFVENATDTLQVIAKDAKIQVEFNPQNVKNYRLIGYDNKILANQDFRNDNVDAGEIGSNHSVTALYEVELNTISHIKSDNATFNGKSDLTPVINGKIADVYMRYKDINNNNLPLESIKQVLASDVRSSYDLASLSFKQASAIALFGEIVRKSYWSYDNSFKDVLNYIKNLKKDDKLNEFISIVEKADSITK